MICDDIADGGKTFIELAKSLNGIVKDINLYVSHGIFSKGLKVLHDAGISKIFTKEGLTSE
jgi:ribose-phosphate pyrophosphokinase